MDKDQRVLAEIERLSEIFKDMPEKDFKICEGLIVQASRLRVLLDDMWADICKNGDVEQFTQSKDTPAYERERPVARIFNARDKNYQTIIKMLLDRIPESAPLNPEAQGLKKFCGLE